ncbi:hexapeptide repeat-containing transferase [Vibrio sinaloensis DSM 21326]|uniref:Serine acetyltransferase n=1 Tax=Vibrio sinaloensis DSM 21326 TaxID=945550 RepID=E8M6W2_PHOS4|nr:DapH/DapD/GlmU-related protein [Vibrio sinaloensis]EGA70266.1 hexapeptide repeat-containing transferase [Vibrio sinaloensis DSM 21326]
MQIKTFNQLTSVLSYEMKVNDSSKSKLIVFMLRVCNYFSNFSKPWRYLFYPVFVLNRLLVEYLLGTEIPFTTSIGKGFRIYHGYGIVINSNTRIGENCSIRHGVTIGNKTLRDGTPSAAPVIGDNVEFGAGSIVIGDICIEDNARVGAGVVVTKDIQANQTVVPQPNRVIG